MAELDSTNVVSRGLLMPDGGAPVLDSVRRVLGYVPTWMSVFASNSAKTRPLLSADFLAANGSRDLFMELLDTLDVHGQLAGRAPVNQSLYLWSKIALPNYILSVLGDRMEMAHSVEGRLPFLDHHVVETARSLPVSAKIRGTTEKFVLREVARPVITPTVYARQKHPFFAPPAAVAADGSLHEMLQETLRGPALERVPFYDPVAVTELLDRLPGLPAAERAPLDVLLMAILSTCVLAERFGIS